MTNRGNALPETAPVDAPVPHRRWWTSWPAIVVASLFWVIPGVILLWLRRGTSVLVKIALTVVAFFVLMLVIGATAGGQDESTTVGADVPETAGSPSATASASPTPTPSVTVSPSATPTPAPTPTPTPTPTQTGHAQAGTAAAALIALDVKPESASGDYEREAFGDGWIDVDRNGCDTRNDMLILRLEEREMSGSCTVLSGRLADPFTGTSIWFERGGASEVDIDHLVALSAAWVTGASEWDYGTRVAFANDPLNLEPVDAGENRSKGDDDASEWLPPHSEFHCQYVARQIAIKTKYELWVTPVESSAMARVLDSCPDQELPAAGDTIVVDIAEPAPKPEPEETADAGETTEDIDPDYGACYKVPAGKGPYIKGEDPEYDYYQDRDGDGVVCE